MKPRTTRETIGRAGRGLVATLRGEKVPLCDEPIPAESAGELPQNQKRIRLAELAIRSGVIAPRDLES